MHELKTPIGAARINTDMLSMRIKNDKNISKQSKITKKYLFW